MNMLSLRVLNESIIMVDAFEAIQGWGKATCIFNDSGYLAEVNSLDPEIKVTFNDMRQMFYLYILMLLMWCVFCFYIIYSMLCGC